MGSFADISNLRKNIDLILKGKIENNLRIDHPNVFTMFFRQISQLYNIVIAIF